MKIWYFFKHVKLLKIISVSRTVVYIILICFFSFLQDPVKDCICLFSAIIESNIKHVIFNPRETAVHVKKKK